MTTLTGPFPAVAAKSLTEDERKAALQWLATEWDSSPEQYQMLQAWAHPSLSFDRVTDLFASFREWDAKERALVNGVEHWSTVFDEDITVNGLDPQETAIGYAGDQARGFLFVLMNGEPQTRRDGEASDE